MVVCTTTPACPASPASPASPAAYFSLDTHRIDGTHDGSYADQKYRDVLFHTPACWSNSSILFANDAPSAASTPIRTAAAMCVSGNAVGMSRLPQAGTSLDVGGTMVVRSATAWPLGAERPLGLHSSTANNFGSTGLVLSSTSMQYNLGGLPTVQVDRNGVVRSTSVLVADGGVFGASNYVRLLDVGVVGIDTSDTASSSFTLRIDSTGPGGERAETALVTGARFLAGAQLYTVTGRDVAPDQIRLDVRAPAGPLDLALSPFAGRIDLDVLQSPAMPAGGGGGDTPVSIGPLSGVITQALPGRRVTISVAFDDTPTHARCCELQALALAAPAEMPLFPLVRAGLGGPLVEIRGARPVASSDGRSSYTSTLLPPPADAAETLLLFPMLRLPVPIPAPVTDFDAAIAPSTTSASVLVLVGATNLLSALGGGASDIVVDTVTRGLQALWCVTPAGITSPFVRVSSTVLAGAGVLHVTVEDDPTGGVQAFVSAMRVRSTLYAQLIGVAVRVAGSQGMDARHVEYGLYPGDPSGTAATRVLVSAATTPGCVLLLSDPASPGPDYDSWLVERTPDADGRLVLRRSSGADLDVWARPPLGPRTVFLQTLLHMSPHTVAPAICLGTGVPRGRAGLTVLGRGTFMDGVVLYNTASSAAMTVDDGGALVMEADTFVRGQVVARSYKTVSDMRLKRDVSDVDVDGALGELMRVLVRGYNFRDDDDRGGGGGGAGGSVRRTGVIAQELERVLPQAVSDTGEGTKVVDANELLFRAIAAIQALARRMDICEGSSSRSS